MNPILNFDVSFFFYIIRIKNMIISKFANLIIKVLVLIKVSYLLIMNSLYPETYPLQLLNWWVYYLIFDIWLNISFNFLREHNVTK